MGILLGKVEIRGKHLGGGSPEPTPCLTLLRLPGVKLLSVEVTFIAIPDNSPIDIQGNAVLLLWSQSSLWEGKA